MFGPLWPPGAPSVPPPAGGSDARTWSLPGAADAVGALAEFRHIPWAAHARCTLSIVRCPVHIAPCPLPVVRCPVCDAGSQKPGLRGWNPDRETAPAPFAPFLNCRQAVLAPPESCCRASGTGYSPEGCHPGLLVGCRVAVSRIGHFPECLARHMLYIWICQAKDRLSPRPGAGANRGTIQ
jgi:hypothetical protein